MNAFENKPSNEKSPVCMLNTINELAATKKSTTSNDFPTSRDVYFLRISATMSVPPDEPFALNIIAEPIDVNSIAYISSSNGWFDSGAVTGTTISRTYVIAE